MLYNSRFSAPNVEKREKGLRGSYFSTLLPEGKMTPPPLKSQFYSFFLRTSAHSKTTFVSCLKLVHDFRSMIGDRVNFALQHSMLASVA